MIKMLRESTIKDTLDTLLELAVGHDWSGFDQHDSLNSRLFNNTIVTEYRLTRLALVQLGVKSPLNIRKIIGVNTQVNPKTLALYLSGCLDLYRVYGDDIYRNVALRLIELIKHEGSEDYSGSCWGYAFPWQARAFYLPSGTPTIVTTSFVANSLLDAYESLGREDARSLAVSSCDFITNDLNRFETDKELCFSYSPIDHTMVHNASMLGAQLLSRVGRLIDNRDYFETATKVVRFSLNHQSDEGAWYYGMANYQNWIDNLHTGYIIDCLRDYIDFTGELWPQPNLELGFNFYKNNLFLIDGTPKYYDNSIYPIDVHCCAQGIITFANAKFHENRAEQIDFSRSVAQKTFEYLWNTKGYFNFQKKRLYTNKINYLRWGQAWMFRALSSLLFNSITKD